MDAILEAIYQNILDGDKQAVIRYVKKALDVDFQPDQILNEAMIVAMDEVGRRYKIGEYYVPEMLVAAKAMQSGLAVLKPSLLNKGVRPLGKVALGTVKGDLHDIGKNLVALLLEGAGFQVIDLGVDTTQEEYLEAVRSGVQIIGMSSLLTTTMPQMKVIIDELSKNGLREKVKIMIGGAPVTQNFADQIKADGYSPDANGAVALARNLIKDKES